MQFDNNSLQEEGNASFHRDSSGTVLLLNYECMIFFKLIFFLKTFSKSSNKNNNSHYFPSAYHLWETYLILYTNLSLFLRPALQSKIIPILQMRKPKIRMNKNIFNCLLLLFMFCLFLYLSSSSKIFTIRGPFHQVYRYWGSKKKKVKQLIF